MKKDLNMRIGIVGAGTAGLTAAEGLKDKGYKNITILEKESFAGGKCRSIKYKGRIYDIGAGVIAKNCTIILNLAKKYNVKIVRVNFSKEIFIDSKTGKPIEKGTPFTEKLSHVIQLLMRYRRLTHRFHNNEKPGLSHVNAELCLPFSEWADKNEVSLVAKHLAPFFTGFGYGYFDEVPAAYVLKHYSWGTVKSFIKKALYKFPNGMQHLWRTIAKNHDVRFGTIIKSITRDKAITVQTKSDKFEFDALILTSPLDESLNYMDVTKDEKTLLSKISYIDYRTYAVRLKDFSKCDGYLPGNFIPTRRGHPVFWHHQYDDSDLYTFYMMSDFKMSDKKAVKNIELVVEQMGGKLLELHSSTHWKYFPNVSREEMENGYYDKLEGLQGKKHTYFAGELMNFSTVELTAEYSQKLINRFF